MAGQTGNKRGGPRSATLTPDAHKELAVCALVRTLLSFKSITAMLSGSLTLSVERTLLLSFGLVYASISLPEQYPPAQSRSSGIVELEISHVF